MKIKYVLLALAILFLFSCTPTPPDIPPATLPDGATLDYTLTDTPLDIALASPQVFVFDETEDVLLYMKGEDKVVYPASTTKLLTILCALEYLSPDAIVIPDNELSLVGTGSSVAYIKGHHQLTVEMLIEGMLLPSGNDAAYVLAAAAGRAIAPSVPDGQAAVAVFLDAMANYAAEIGLVGTCFTTPDGLAGAEHYSTLADLLLISRLAQQNDIIRRYAGLHRDHVTYASGHTNDWVNTNALLDPQSPYYDSRVTGLKTGSLDSNYCLIFSAEIDGHTYLAGVFGAAKKADRYTDAAIILAALDARAEEVGA